MNSQHQNANLKGDFVFKKPGLNIHFKDFCYIKINPTHRFGMISSINKHERLDIASTHNAYF